MAFFIIRLRQSLRSSIVLTRKYSSQRENTVIKTDELATGKQKLELLALEAGEEDPFDYKPLKRGPNSRDQPIIIHSHGTDSRIVGCVCHEESRHIQWFWLHEGEPMRCGCGHWYKLDTSVS